MRLGGRLAQCRGWQPHSCRNASTGSIRAARLAGNRPNTSPIPMLTPTHATTALQSGTPDCIESSAYLSTSPDASPNRMPIRPPMSVSVAASTRNCQRISRRVAPQRLAESDLPGAIGDRDHHDRHDADPADQQRHARERDHDEEERRR